MGRVILILLALLVAAALWQRMTRGVDDSAALAMLVGLVGHPPDPD